MPSGLDGQEEGRRRIIPVAALLLCAAVTAVLGAWQIKRLAWKEALIADVDHALHAAPLAQTPSGQLNGAITPYRRIALTGHYLPATTTLVATASELGSGYWDMVVLDSGTAQKFWINRGFVPTGSQRDIIARATPTTAVSIIGLARASEPKGRFLRANQPAAEHWYSRDLAAFNASRQAIARQDWFVDAQTESPAANTPSTLTPVAGLTVVNFPNNHLQYALTWFALSVLSLGGAVLVFRARG